MNKISAVINTYNEENNIVDCLQTINWVEEIILVDTGSTDRTIEYARKFTKNIFIYSCCDYVEQVRNFGINKAKNDWILIIDADETLPVVSEKIIRHLIKNKSIDGYLFPRRNYISRTTYLKHGYFYPDYQLRLFRNRNNIRYSSVIHEQPKIIKERTKLVPELEIIHNSSHSKYNAFSSFRRFFSYILIEGKDFAEKKDLNYGFLFNSLYETCKHFFRSFIRLKGYKDGYFGFRAAILFGLYKESIQIYAMWYKFRNLRKT